VLQINAAERVIGAAAGRGEKHHYIPVFYSREWTGLDGRLCEYSRPFREVKPRWTHPDGTGYVRGLYNVPKNDPRLSDFIERHFLRITDNGAAVVAQQLRNEGKIDFFSLDRSSWSRFIISLMLRNPEYVARMGAEVARFFDSKGRYEERYHATKRPDDPDTYEEFIAKTVHHPAGPASVYAMQNLIDSPRMGGYLNQMRWAVVTYKNERHTLLTSDRPIIMSNGLIGPSDYLILPIGPRMLFLATNNIETEDRFRAISAGIFMAQVNNRVVSQARKYVYGTDNTQLRFVENRLGRMWPSMPLEPLPVKGLGER
jgi:hypothetical protein